MVAKLIINDSHAESQSVQADLSQKTVVMRAQLFVNQQPTGSYLQVVVGAQAQQENDLQYATPSFDEILASNPKAQVALEAMQELVLDMFDKYSKAMDVPKEPDEPNAMSEPDEPNATPGS